MPEHGEVVLLTGWHFDSMLVMPRQFWRFRRLDHLSRQFPGRIWSHRWVSRRSLLYTSRWQSVEDAEQWLNSLEFRRFDAGARAVGATPRVELLPGGH